MKRPSLRQAIVLALVLLAVGLIVLAEMDIPVVSLLATVGMGGLCLLGLLWLFFLGLRRFLWKVGRRLAFSYFLIGALPIPMVLLLLGVVAYLLAGTLSVHLFKDAVAVLQEEVEGEARRALLGWAHAGASGPLPQEGSFAFAYYRGGKRVAGDSRAPDLWPAWAKERPRAAAAAAAARHAAPPPLRFFGVGEAVTAAAAVDDGPFGVLAWYNGDFEREISRRTGLWVEINRPGDPGLEVVRISTPSRTVPLLTVRHSRDQREIEKFFKQSSQGAFLLDRPLIWWGGLAGTLYDLKTGRLLAEDLGATVNSTPRALKDRLFPQSEEVNTVAWLVFTTLAVLLAEVYLMALAMAVFMIFGLSRAVNQMSRATAAVQEGDFSVRIPVKRKDQLGALQRSFNSMNTNLERLVATAAQKEALEKEVSLAREVQKSLVPQRLPTGRGLEFATVFEPSAAIGGDYYDILSLPDGRVAIIIADVSGHGLSSGLRMAMLKAALLVSTDEVRDPEAIFARLDHVVRAEQSHGRAFVTATLALLDVERETLEITNAGHPPTYLLRGGQVEEILLPSSPLGGLGQHYGRKVLPVAAGDTLVWLSDGLIEATNAADEPLGYEGIVAALAGPTTTAAAVKDRLLAAIAAHTAGAPASDDRTMVVLHYEG